MEWQVRVTKPAQKSLDNFPEGYRKLINRALAELEIFPFRGDIQKLGPASWRKRVASYRIFFDVYHEDRVIVVNAITRRKSNTY